MSSITIYTDGSSRGNPGPGGYGTILIAGNHRKEISQGYRLTTNNRMELMSVIAGLEALKRKGEDVETGTVEHGAKLHGRAGCVKQEAFRI